MRVTLLTLMFLFSVLQIASQNLSITKCEELSQDITASTKIRYDGNDTPCALVKVHFPEKGLHFQGNVVGDTEFKNGEYLVYLTDGSKELEVKHDSYYPFKISFKDYNILKVSSKRTYLLEITNNIKHQILNISYSPEDAMVLIDDENIEAHNGEAHITLSVGEHRYNVLSNGYFNQVGSITIREDSPGKLIVALDKKNSTTMSPSLSSSNNISGYLNIPSFEIHELTDWNYIYGSQPQKYVLILDNHKKIADAKSTLKKVTKGNGCIINAYNTYFAIAYSSNDVNEIQKEWEHAIGKYSGAWVALLNNNKANNVSEIPTNKRNEDELASPITVNASQHIYTAEEINLETKVINDWSFENGTSILRYGIVVGSFGVKANAMALLNKLGNEGYVIQDKQKNFYRVISFSSDDALEIKNKLELISKSYPYSWVAFFNKK